MRRLVRNFLVLTLLCGILLYIFTSIYIAGRVYFDNKTKSDAIIVLGAKSFINGEVNQCVKARVQHAIDLYNDGLADKIIMSGGNDKKPVFQNTNEGEEMKKMALGIDPEINIDDILVEGESTSTYENLLYSKEIMKRNNLTTAIIVTEPFHSPRANLIANKLDINHTISPTMTSHCWNRWKYFSGYFLREALAVIGYKLIGQI